MKTAHIVAVTLILAIPSLALAFGVISGIDIIPAWMAIGALLTRHWRLLETMRK